MLRLLTENKIASVGAVAMVTGVVLLLSASTVDTGSDDSDTMSTAQMANVSKKKTLLAVGGSILSIGVLAQVYDQYTRFTSPRRSLSSSQYRSSSQMSPDELSSFQDRVSMAAAKLRRSIADTSSGGTRRTPRNSSMRDSIGDSSGFEQESAAELAARASAQISSFIQNYS